MKYCIDIDGVVCEYDFPAIVKESFGVDIFENAIYAYDIADVLGISPITVNNMFKEQVYGRPRFVEGSLDTLIKWFKDGIELVIYSNRVKYMSYGGLADWMIHWNIPFSSIDGGREEYLIHIDDSPAKLMSTNSKHKLLFNQPWNERCIDITNSLIRVYNWQEVDEYVSTLFPNT